MCVRVNDLCVLLVHVHAPCEHGQGYGVGADYTGVVRLRGLPFEATQSDIALFFRGIQISLESIALVKSASGAGFDWL